jgi:cyclopropane-fatty-acyl-phospholipid synthase
MIRARIDRDTPLHAFGRIDRVARRIVASQLSSLDHGRLVLRDPNGVTTYGGHGDLHATLTVHRPRFFRHAVLGGTLSVAASYFDGDWDCDDLTSLFRIFLRNRESAERFDRGPGRVAGAVHRVVHWLRSNTLAGSRRNIAAHYDLGNEFYRLWLDDSLAYSSGIFRGSEASLESASLEKFDRVCRKLDLQPADEVLEIGSGWGGFALHAATNYRCHVTTTTISERQFDLAAERVCASPASDRITLLKRDYRELRGEFDKLVSIEMIEAVGHGSFDTYFGRCSDLLRADGSFVLQAIVMPDRGYDRYLRSVDFIQRYVFPGGCLPSPGAILSSVGRSTDLRLVHVEDFAPHYAETLRRWRRAFESQIAAVRGLGYSDEFIRLWRYYLCYCEAAFEERYVGVVQMQFDKPRCRRDPLDLSERAAARRTRHVERIRS